MPAFRYARSPWCLIFARHPVGDWGMAALGGAGTWLGSITGLTIFALHPSLPCWRLCAPVVAGGSQAAF